MRHASPLDSSSARSSIRTGLKLFHYIFSLAIPLCGCNFRYLLSTTVEDAIFFEFLSLCAELRFSWNDYLEARRALFWCSRHVEDNPPCHTEVVSDTCEAPSRRTNATDLRARWQHGWVASRRKEAALSAKCGQMQAACILCVLEAGRRLASFGPTKASRTDRTIDFRTLYRRPSTQIP